LAFIKLLRRDFTKLNAKLKLTPTESATKLDFPLSATLIVCSRKGYSITTTTDPSLATHLHTSHTPSSFVPSNV